MAYPCKIEYLFKTQIDLKMNTCLPFWEVTTMKKLLESMHIPYTVEKRLTYSDQSILHEIDQQLPFDLDCGDVVSIYGASGKTSTLYSLAQLCKDYKVLCSTTTKMFYPKEYQVDREVYNSLPRVLNGITFYADRYDATKCKSPTLAMLEQAVNGFDFSFIESDGTKRRPMKFYNEDEPIHMNKMNKGIIVCSLDRIGEVISDDTVHRADKFCDHYDVKLGDTITPLLFAEYLSDLQGVMKPTSFPVYLFFNKIESFEQYQLMLDVVSKLDYEVKSHIEIWFGSAHLSVYEHLGGMTI